MTASLTLLVNARPSPAPTPTSAVYVTWKLQKRHGKAKLASAAAIPIQFA